MYCQTTSMHHFYMQRAPLLCNHALSPEQLGNTGCLICCHSCLATRVANFASSPVQGLPSNINELNPRVYYIVSYMNSCWNRICVHTPRGVNRFGAGAFKELIKQQPLCMCTGPNVMNVCEEGCSNLLFKAITSGTRLWKPPLAHTLLLKPNILIN